MFTGLLPRKYDSGKSKTYTAIGKSSVITYVIGEASGFLSADTLSVSEGISVFQKKRLQYQVLFYTRTHLRIHLKCHLNNKHFYIPTIPERHPN